ncbi:MAG: hypothetical protein KC561_02370, partial [Myxococcales bacterium]|nr:hypothetical protein [Myxococcales bacterium]
YHRNDLGEWNNWNYLKPADLSRVRAFGASLALSSDGSHLVVGAPAASGSEGLALGRAWVFEQAGGTWRESAEFEHPDPGPADQFAFALSISGDGQLVAVGVPYDDSHTAGVGGDYNSNNLVSAGSVFLFRQGQEEWEAEAYVQAAYPTRDATFGTAVELSEDGSILLVGAPRESLTGGGINATPTNDRTGTQTGATYRFLHTGEGWELGEYLKAPGGSDAQAEPLTLWFGYRLLMTATGELSASLAFLDGESDTPWDIKLFLYTSSDRGE